MHMFAGIGNSPVMAPTFDMLISYPHVHTVRGDQPRAQHGRVRARGAAYVRTVPSYHVACGCCL